MEYNAHLTYDDYYAARRADVVKYGATARALRKIAKQHNVGTLTNEDYVMLTLQVILNNHPNG